MGPKKLKGQVSKHFRADDSLPEHQRCNLNIILKLRAARHAASFFAIVKSDPLPARPY
jgi:hypothetical protein